MATESSTNDGVREYIGQSIVFNVLMMVCYAFMLYFGYNISGPQRFLFVGLGIWGTAHYALRTYRVATGYYDE